jgi:3-phenylpropionate/cinnamic acid dioxygenase small subunit
MTTEGGDRGRASDELDIRNLIGRVALLADTTPDLQRYLALFTEDAVWDFPGDAAQQLPASRTQGHAAILADRQERRGTGFQGPGTHTRHLVTVLAVEVDAGDADAATADSYWMYLTHTDTAPALQSMGQYHDTFVRGPAGWKLSHRQISLG